MGGMELSGTPENLNELKQRIVELYEANGPSEELEDMRDRWEQGRRDEIEQEILRINAEAKEGILALAQEEGVATAELERYIERKQVELGTNIKESIVRMKLEIEIIRVYGAMGRDKSDLIEAADALWEGTKKLGEEMAIELNRFINELESL